VRSLDVGQVAYVYRGGVTFIQVKRVVAAPAALVAQPVPASRAAAEPPRTAGPPPGEPPRPPDAGPLLDEAFGRESR